MTGMTLEFAEQQLTHWQGVYASASGVQSWSNRDRSATHYSLDEIQRQITYWDNKVKSLSSGRNGGPRVRGVMPL